MVIATKSIKLLEVEMVVPRDEQLPRVARSFRPPHGGKRGVRCKAPHIRSRRGRAIHAPDSVKNRLEHTLPQRERFHAPDSEDYRLKHTMPPRESNPCPNSVNYRLEHTLRQRESNPCSRFCEKSPRTYAASQGEQSKTRCHTRWVMPLMARAALLQHKTGTLRASYVPALY